MPLPGFEPGSPRPHFKSDDLDRSAMENYDCVAFKFKRLVFQCKRDFTKKKYLSFWGEPTHY